MRVVVIGYPPRVPVTGDAGGEKLADVDAKLAELQRIRQGLTELVESCPGHGALVHCPIMGALAGADA